MTVSIRAKTMLGVAIIEGVLLAILITVAVGFMRDSSNEALKKRAETTVRLFATTTKDAVLSYDLASLEIFTAELIQNPDIEYVRVLTPDKQLLSSAGQAQRIDQPFVADTSVESTNDGIFDVYSEIREQNEVYGRIELGLAVDSITQAMNRVKNWTVTIAIMEMFLVAVFSYFLGIYLTRNLYKLREATNTMSENLKQGIYENESPVIESNDELEDLSRSFDNLNHTLKQEHQRRQQYENDLIELNATLEKRVAHRTEQLKQQNDSLEQANQELALAQQKLVQSEKMASVGQLAAGVAHEINNPLGFVTSNLGTLNDYLTDYQRICDLAQALPGTDVESLPDALNTLQHLLKEIELEYLHEDCKDIVSESIGGLKRIADIVADLKQFSHVDGHSLEPASINDCIKAALNMVNNEIKYHCRVHTELAELPDIPLNPGKVVQVITNLLINGSQAIEGKGDIFVSTRLIVERQPHQVEVRVKDTGKGIADDILTKIFDPFFTTKPVGKGTGLGLSVSYDIMQEHHGHIDVSSSLGEGTEFVLSFPVESTHVERQPVNRP